MENTALDRIRLSLKRRKLDAILITQPENRRYVSGYTASDLSINETSGVLLVPASGTPYLLTDSRYQLQAESETEGFQVKLYNRGLFALLRRLFKTLEIKRLAFESHYLLHSTYISLEKVARKRNVELVSLTAFVEDMRIIKNKEEVDRIRKSVHLNEEVFQTVYRDIRPGVTEQQVALQIETTMRRMGAEGPSFETIVAAGPNGAMPHAVPTDRPLQEGEPIIMDMGLKLDGYCSDMTRTIVLGAPDRKTKGLIRLVREAQLAGLRALRSGETGQAVDRAARNVISRAGLADQFGHGLGHGVGMAVHEAPALNWRYRKQLKAGMVVTVEPGVYLPGWGGVRLENMAVVTRDGCELLNNDTTFLDI